MPVRGVKIGFGTVDNSGLGLRGKVEYPSRGHVSLDRVKQGTCENESKVDNPVDKWQNMGSYQQAQGD
jgi:hypothetical protein